MTHEERRQKARSQAFGIVRQWAGDDKLDGRLRISEIKDLHDHIATALGQAMTESKPEIIHGQTCPKFPHEGISTYRGWNLNILHSQDDDCPFHCAGKQICGRCHEVFPNA